MELLSGTSMEHWKRFEPVNFEFYTFLCLHLNCIWNPEPWGWNLYEKPQGCFKCGTTWFFLWSLVEPEPSCGTLMWNRGEPCARFPAAAPNHPEALLEEPQAFQAVRETNGGWSQKWPRANASCKAERIQKDLTSSKRAWDFFTSSLSFLFLPSIGLDQRRRPSRDKWTPTAWQWPALQRAPRPANHEQPRRHVSAKWETASHDSQMPVTATGHCHCASNSCKRLSKEVVACAGKAHEVVGLVGWNHAWNSTYRCTDLVVSSVTSLNSLWHVASCPNTWQQLWKGNIIPKVCSMAWVSLDFPGFMRHLIHPDSPRFRFSGENEYHHAESETSWFLAFTSSLICRCPSFSSCNSSSSAWHTHTIILDAPKISAC